MDALQPVVDGWEPNNIFLYGNTGGLEWVSVVVNGTFGLSLTAAGLLLRTEARPAEQAESTETVA